MRVQQQKFRWSASLLSALLVGVHFLKEDEEFIGNGFGDDGIEELAQPLANGLLMRATFPAGTVSGAPKIRAMQLIAELEGTTRGPYGGCVGYFSFNGNLDTCITIRTALIKDGRAYVQAGGGWVNDSTPEGEYQETINKSMAMRKAIAMAENFSKA